jgi:hypothetical protein
MIEIDLEKKTKPLLKNTRSFLVLVIKPSTEDKTYSYFDVAVDANDSDANQVAFIFHPIAK